MVSLFPIVFIPTAHMVKRGVCDARIYYWLTTFKDLPPLLMLTRWSLCSFSYAVVPQSNETITANKSMSLRPSPLMASVHMTKLC